MYVHCRLHACIVKTEKEVWKYLEWVVVRETKETWRQNLEGRKKEKKKKKKKLPKL